MKLFLLLALVAASAQANPAQRAISLFNVVSFKNDPCSSNVNIANSNSGQSQRQGNCVSASECTDQKGEASGSCAAGFGVCCVFTLNDDEETSYTITRNNTYIQNPSFPTAFSEAETFTYKFEKENKEICAIRLDFESFTIAAPADEATACTDKFEISDISTDVTIPEVCGDLTGQHMYLYLGNDNEGDSATAKITTVGTADMRQWDIKVGQIHCTSEYLPPMGCLQYHMESSGIIKSFNFDDSDNIALPNQDYSVCVRRMAGFCCVEYQVCSNEADGYTWGGNTLAAADVLTDCTEDYIVIEGGSQTGEIPTRNKYCGGIFNDLGTAVANVPIISCDDNKVRIVSDADAEDTAAFPNPKGLCLEYKLLPC